MLRKKEFAEGVRFDIPGYNGKYFATVDGEIWRVFKSGFKKMSVFRKGNIGVVKLDYRDENAARICARAFGMKIPDGCVVRHKNGIILDNARANIEIVSRSEAGKTTGRKAKSRCVLKIDQTGNVIDTYYSAREAARKNYMSRQTITDICNGKVKRLEALDGYYYAWEREKSLRPIAEATGKDELYEWKN